MKTIIFSALSLVLLLGITSFTVSESRDLGRETMPPEAMEGAGVKDTIETMQEHVGPTTMGSNPGQYFAATMIPYYEAGKKLSHQLGVLSKDTYVAQLAADVVSRQSRLLNDVQRWQGEKRPVRIHLSDNSKRSFLRLMEEVRVDTWNDMTPALSSLTPEQSYMTILIAHSQGAVDMAKVLLIFEADQELRSLAGRIIVEQQGDIRSMQSWLRQH